jgi:hypothetical protein
MVSSIRQRFLRSAYDALGADVGGRLFPEFFAGKAATAWGSRVK